ncbi:hypothetical protein HYDPIDRAFT_31215 [Hydnomerulius pinastri MD-312]|uniref:WD40 repeat-like protein n=1 Tax=Hydnomerulius pinastri MD-312 TaxID=994086 RepID=A0A0C9WCG1_9AGAM|nr:hypothetical protein HYDPIDRAFT_31215 [Hydnomerulius pinastri MD-312]
MYRGTGAQNTYNQFAEYASPDPPPVHRQDQQPRDFSYDRLDSRRKQTLLNLLSALNELSQSESLGQDFNNIPSFEDDRDVPTVDEQLQVAGAEVFNRFHRRINNLDKELRNFANAARQLGSSVGILSTAFRLRERLARVLFLFRDNAADLFPRKVARQPRETLVNPNVMEKRRRKNKTREGAWGGFGEGASINPSINLGSTSPPTSSSQHPNAVRPFADSDLEAERFPEHFEAFAADVVAFLNCLNEFPEFTDEAVNASIRAFEGDLKYWACCLNTYKGQFKYPAVQRYIHDLTSEMGEHIDSITSTLSMFIEVGVPTIRFAQKHGASNLLTLSTVATFFSAVTATTLQFSYSSTSTVLAKSVNAFWFSSLVFSIAAAVNSLLGLSWKMAMYRSPGHRVPWWVLIWIKRSPLVFLVMWVLLLKLPLMQQLTDITSYHLPFVSSPRYAPLHCWTRGRLLHAQGKVTSTITTVFTAFTSFGLAAVSAWFASEKWTFVRFRGQKWLEDVLGETWTKVGDCVGAVMRVPPFSWIAWLSALIWSGIMWVWVGVDTGSRWAWNGMEHGRRRVKRGAVWTGVKLGLRPVTDMERANDNARPPSLSMSFRTAATGTEKDDSTVLPMSMSPTSMSSSPLFGQARYDSSRLPRPSSLRLRPDFHRSMDLYEPGSPTASSQGHLALNTSGIASGSASAGQPSSPLTPRDRFTHAIRSVMMLQSASSGASPFAPKRQRTTSSALTGSSVFTGTSVTGPGGSSLMLGGNTKGPGLGNSNGASGLRGSRLATLIPKLRSLEATQDISAHTALVRHLQFSPNGKFMATSSWDRTSIIFKVGDHFEPHRVLAHASGFVGQVAWSPLGNLLLTKLNRVIKIWTEEGVCRKTIDRQCAVQAATWMPGGEAIMSVEGSEVVKLDLNGKVLDKYAFDRVLIHDVAVTPDSLRLLGVGPILSSPTGLQPSKSRVEKQLLVYNLETKTIENQTPVLNDVRDITLARNGQVALISYENKAPPQLWKLDVVKDRMDSTTTTARLTLRHTYMPKMPVDFAGHSYFGGKDDQLVLCAGKAGDIYIWDRDSAVLLHHVRAQALGGDLTCIAWNQSAENPFMFATGSHDGAVRIWTTPPPPDPANRPQQTTTARSTPYSMTPRSPSPVHMGMRTTDSPVWQLQALADDFAVGSITARPFTRSPEEDTEFRDRSVTFAPPRP